MIEDSVTTAESQQTDVEQNGPEEVPFAAQEAPIPPEVVEDKDVSIPDVQETRSPNASIQEINASKDGYEPITFVEALTPNESAVDPTVSLPPFYPFHELNSVST